MSFIRDILFYHISNVAGGEKWLHMFCFVAKELF